MRKNDGRIPVVDLFSGPGGLGEGFSRYPFDGDSRFRICVSIEMEENAHRTLTTRAFYRQFQPGEVPEAYYEHLRGKITQEEMFAWDEECRSAARAAKDEAHRIELGDKPDEEPDPEKRARVKKLIGDRIKGHKNWVLIGGPPCQAYSLAGRSRRLGPGTMKENESAAEFQRRKDQNTIDFENDHRHLLYREYLSIIADHWPPIFVMENVKGLLSAKLAGKPMFPMIHGDLMNPNLALERKGRGHKYRICSLSVPTLVPGEGLEGRDYLVKAENYGVPQRRHRVILLGIRDDIDVTTVPTIEPSVGPDIENLFNGLPPLISGVSKKWGVEFHQVLANARKSKWLRDLRRSRENWSKDQMMRVHDRICMALDRLELCRLDQGGQFCAKPKLKPVSGPMGEWLHDARIGGVCNHETRDHMPEDFHRYLFCSAFASILGKSPKLEDFPESLLPNHKNVKGDDRDLKKHADRFRALMYRDFSATVTCHISQDGHAFIHPDPRQMRSLTVREAARIQTFPDNYFFEGCPTAQYKQVGNAVPPFLAHQIAGVVSQLFKDAG